MKVPDDKMLEQFILLAYEEIDTPEREEALRAILAEKPMWQEIYAGVIQVKQENGFIKASDHLNWLAESKASFSRFLDENLASMPGQEIVDARKNTIPSWLWLGAAALALLLLWIGYQQLGSGSQVDYLAIARDHYSNPLFDTTAYRSPSENSLFFLPEHDQYNPRLILNHFRSGETNFALDSLHYYQEKDSSRRSYLILIEAALWRELNEDSLALNLYSELASEANNRYRGTAQLQYYLTLILIGREQEAMDYRKSLLQDPEKNKDVIHYFDSYQLLP